jgi:hypothetical protein
MKTTSPWRPASESQSTSVTRSSAGTPYRSASVVRRSQAARNAKGTLWRPRLRSRKRSGSPLGCNAYDILDARSGNAVVLRNFREILTRPEPLQDVRYTSTTLRKDRLAE